MPKGLSEKIIFYSCLIILAAVGAWLFRMTFFFSDSFDFLVIRDIDDILFHQNLDQMRRDLMAGNFPLLLSNTNHAYGNIYWLPLFLITLPSMLWGPDWLTILIPRNYSLVAYIFCFIAFYRIARVRGATATQSLLGLVLMASCSLPFGAATRFHNHTFCAAFILWSFYFLLVEGKDKNKNLLKASVLFGLAVGVKVVSLSMAPVFLFLFNMSLPQNTVGEKIKKNLIHFLIIFATAVVSFSPSLLYVVLGETQPFKEDIAQLDYMLFQRHMHLSGIGFLKHLWENVVSVYFHWIIVLIGMGIAFFLAFKERKQSWRSQLIPIATAITGLSLLAVVYVTRRDPYLMRPYIIAHIFIFCLLFVDWMVHVRWAQYTILTLALLNLYLNQKAFREYQLVYPMMVHDSKVLERINKYNLYKEKQLLKESDKISIDFTILFPLGLIHSAPNVTYVFDRNIDIREKDVFIFNKKHPDFYKTCDELEAQQFVPKQNCLPAQNVLNGGDPYKSIYEDDDIRVVRWFPAKK